MSAFGVGMHVTHDNFNGVWVITAVHPDGTIEAEPVTGDDWIAWSPGTVDDPATMLQRAPVPGELCRVFALCENEATTTIDGRVLGPIPACQRCADKIERLKR